MEEAGEAMLSNGDLETPPVAIMSDVWLNPASTPALQGREWMRRMTSVCRKALRRGFSFSPDAPSRKLSLRPRIQEAVPFDDSIESKFIKGIDGTIAAAVAAPSDIILLMSCGEGREAE
jgi:hypothetical protein